VRWIDGLSKAQRIVLVIALGLALATIGGYVVNLGAGAPGWVAYAPLSSGPYVPNRGLDGWLRMIIWLVLISVWALASVRVLRPSSEHTDS
jgi:heme/copper-type cytochrome/quinol oxidase subunit 1